jgi:aerobic-type carbon monoxide dehydrogenase small subunit (CoxS/CutS family)
MVMSATALMETETTFDDEIVREYMDGNLCRCTGYEKIVDAVLSTAAILDSEGGVA